MEANSFQMCQGTRAEPREPALQRTPAVAGRLEGTGPLDRDFRIAKAAGQILAQKLHANACVRGEGDPPGLHLRSSGETSAASCSAAFFLQHPTITLFSFLCGETAKQSYPVSGKVFSQHQLCVTNDEEW